MAKVSKTIIVLFLLLSGVGVPRIFIGNPWRTYGVEWFGIRKITPPARPCDRVVQCSTVIGEIRRLRNKCVALLNIVKTPAPLSRSIVKRLRRVRGIRLRLLWNNEIQVRTIIYVRNDAPRGPKSLTGTLVFGVEIVRVIFHLTGRKRK